MPLLLESVESSPHPPTLVLSGATASLRGSVRWAAAAAGKSGQRILNQSLAREFGPRGVHVAHVIIDGGIDIPGRENIQFNNGAPDSKISPEAVSGPDHRLVIWSIDLCKIADSYWYLHTQHRSAFTHELDLRPYIEKF